MDPGAVRSGSTLFASILNSSVMLGNYLQQTTSAEDIFRSIFSWVLSICYKDQNLLCWPIYCKPCMYSENLDLHCFQKRINPASVGHWLNKSSIVHFKIGDLSEEKGLYRFDLYKPLQGLFKTFT